MLFNPDWIELTAMDQLDLLEKESASQSIVIFKHSTTCGISNQVMHGLNDDWEEFTSGSFKFYYLDLLNYRPISHEIARRLNVIHQSPQIIVVKNGKAVYSSSHFAVKAEAIAAKL